MQTITAEDLKKLIDNKGSYRLIDLRESYVFDEFNLGGENIPFGEFLNKYEHSEHEFIIIYCASGTKSKVAISTLTRKMSYTNLYSLEGGLNTYLENL